MRKYSHLYRLWISSCLYLQVVPVTLEINCSSLLFVIRTQSCVFSNTTGVKASNHADQNWNSLQFRSLWGLFRKMKLMSTFAKKKTCTVCQEHILRRMNRLSKKELQLLSLIRLIGFSWFAFRSVSLKYSGDCYELLHVAAASRKSSVSAGWNKKKTKVDNISLNIYAFLERHSVVQYYCPKGRRILAPARRICSTRQRNLI
jgi:hypothetical protein